MKKKALIIVNVGTPNNRSVKAVRKFLSQFLNDKRVIDIPFLARKLLVNLIIVPFRAPKSAKLYHRLWSEARSPILMYLNTLAYKVHEKSEEFDVYPAMRYGLPSFKKVLNEVYNKNYDEVIILPLFPQYASSTTGSVIEYSMNILKNRNNFSGLKFINQFYSHPAFVKVFADNIKSYKPEEYDYIVFSYHGLPNRQVQKSHPEIENTTCNCEKEFPEHGKLCYKAVCYETTRLLAKAANLPKEKYTVSFQSRLSKNWMTPFTDETLIKLARKGIKKVLITAPSFVADCLETTIELKHEYNELFLKHGGKQLTLVESLNNSDEWADAVLEIVR